MPISTVVESLIPIYDGVDEEKKKWGFCIPPVLDGRTWMFLA